MDVVLKCIKKAVNQLGNTQAVIQSIDILEDEVIVSEGLYHLLYDSIPLIRQVNVTAGPLSQPVIAGKGMDTLFSDTKIVAKELKLSGFSISDAAIIHLINCQKKLQLLFCTFSSKLFADSLKTNCVLTELSMARTDLNSEDAVLLAESLERNNTLLVMDLSGNKIGDKGASAIYKALQRNTTLCELNISSNRFKGNYELEFSIHLFQGATDHFTVSFKNSNSLRFLPFL